MESYIMLTNNTFDLKMIWEIELGKVKNQLARISSGRIQLSQKLQQLLQTTNQDLNRFIKYYIHSLANYKISTQEYKYLNELWTDISLNAEKIISLWEKSDIKIDETELNQYSEVLSQESTSLFNAI